MKNRHLQLLVFSTMLFLATFISMQLHKNIFDPEYIPPDTYTYIESSELLYNQLIPHPYRPMGYALILGVPFLFSNAPSVDAIIVYSTVLNFMLWISTILILSESLSFFVNSKVSSAVTIVFVLCVGNIAQIGLVLTETIMTFLLTLTAYFMFKYKKSSNSDYLIWAVTIFNISAVIRPGMIYWGLTLSTILFPYLIIKGHKLSSAKTIFPIVFSLVVVTIQSFSVYQQYGNFTLSYIDRLASYYYLGAQTHSSVNGTSFKEERTRRMERLADKSWPDKYEISTSDLEYQVNNNPSKLLENFLSNIKENTSTGNHGVSGAKNYSNDPIHEPLKLFLEELSKMQNILFSSLVLIMCIYIAFNFHLFNIALFASLGSSVYIILTSGISFWQGDRFSLVFYPVTLIVLFYILSNNEFARKKLKLS